MPAAAPANGSTSTLTTLPLPLRDSGRRGTRPRDRELQRRAVAAEHRGRDTREAHAAALIDEFPQVGQKIPRKIPHNNPLLLLTV